MVLKGSKKEKHVDKKILIELIFIEKVLTIPLALYAKVKLIKNGMKGLMNNSRKKILSIAKSFVIVNESVKGLHLIQTQRKENAHGRRIFRLKCSPTRV